MISCYFRALDAVFMATKLFLAQGLTSSVFFSIQGRSKAASRYKGPASAPTPFFTPSVHAQMGQGQLHLDSTAGPPPVGYVNRLAYQGYSVEIIGGKHYKTPDGEFVELKSGTQYKIQVKNSHVYGKDTYISPIIA